MLVLKKRVCYNQEKGNVKMKKICIIMIYFVCLLGLTGCSEKAKTFMNDAGIEITLNESFYEKDLISQTLYLESAKMAFIALKEEKSLIEQATGTRFDLYSLFDYTRLVIRNNQLSADIKSDDDLLYFIYEKEVSGKNFTYQAYTFKGSDAFWLCQFAVETKNYDELSSDIFYICKKYYCRLIKA